jgi:hypothetical protein
MKIDEVMLRWRGLPTRNLRSDVSIQGKRREECQSRGCDPDAAAGVACRRG